MPKMGSFLLLFFFFFIFPVFVQSQNTSFYFEGFNEAADYLTQRLQASIMNNPRGVLRLTDESKNVRGRAYFNKPIQMFDKASSPNASSFSTSFVFEIVPPSSGSGGYGLAFFLAPFTQLPGDGAGHFLGVFNNINDGNPSNHIFLVDFITVNSFNDGVEAKGNHVGMGLNQIFANLSEPTSFYVNDTDHKEDFPLEGSGPIQAWIEYDGVQKVVNVTVSPINMRKPVKPLISWKRDLTGFLNDNMYAGFSASTGKKSSSHYILGWSFQLNGVAPQLNVSMLPRPPPRVTAEMKWGIIAIVGALVVILLCLLSYVARRKYKRKEEKWWLSLTVAVGIVILVPLWCHSCNKAWRKHKAEVQRKTNRRKLLRELGDNKDDKSSPIINDEKDQATNHELKIFDFHTIATATDNFSTANKLGEGGFGPVYKGKLLDDGEIAIKRLSRRSGQGIIEFKNEAKLIAKLQHTNLVKLVGSSLQGEERILVYEYMHNKSLDFFIFDSDRKKLLDWKKRLNIIEGIAQGLIYLHKYSRLRVIHRDLKASNILLDNQMNPKISDFGLARIFGVNESEVNTNRVVGTYGYMSPEYAMSGIVSTKTDVFSFGVLVLEIVSGKTNNSCYHTEYPLNLVGYAWQLWNEGKGLELIDTALEESCSPNEVLRCVHVGLLCVQDQAADRPTMSDVVSMLANETMLLPAPKQPAFFINVHSEEQEFSEIKIDNCSTNDVTISELEAR